MTDAEALKECYAWLIEQVGEPCEQVSEEGADLLRRFAKIVPHEQPLVEELYMCRLKAETLAGSSECPTSFKSILEDMIGDINATLANREADDTP